MSSLPQFIVTISLVVMLITTTATAFENPDVTEVTNLDIKQDTLEDTTTKAEQYSDYFKQDETNASQSPNSNHEEDPGGAVEARLMGNDYKFSDEYSQQDHHAAFRKRAKPLKSIFMGIYKNYKSTYLGNNTSLEYKKRLKDHKKKGNPSSNVQESEALPSTNPEEPHQSEEQVTDGIVTTEDEVTAENEGSFEHSSNTETTLLEHTTFDNLSTEKPDAYLAAIRRKHRKRKRKFRNNHKTSKKHLKIAPPTGGDDPLVAIDKHEYRYNVGPGLNMSLDMDNDIVNVRLDATSLMEIMRGRWLKDNSEEGRGKKYDMMTKVLPLFVLPFLIQSAIVPFLVTKLKLLLMKSILVGKLAIFLLIISAIRSGSKSSQTYEVAPSYWAGEPSRRSEYAAAASSAAYNGYRVEGKPTAWIN